jgi:predicted RecB family nuclease
MIVSSQLFEAYLECSTKCWLRSRAEPATGNFYAEWARPQNETYLEYGLKRSFATTPEGDRATSPPIPENPKDVTWCLAVDVRWRTKALESCVQAVERIPSEGHGRPAQFIPYRFEFANKLAKEHKLLLAFDALLLSEALGREVTLGKIVHGNSQATLKVKIPAFAGEVRKRIKQVTALLAGNSPPDLVLNRHCGQCEFKTRCSMQARETEELSLLSGLSEKDRKRLHSKGIFTVTQLSYTFRPRRRPRESRGKQEKYHHSLRALAIRENKIHAVGIPDLKLKDTPVFLDVEGLPDRNFYYLIGIRLQAAEGSVQHSFWADDAKGEKLIWNDFLGVLSEIANPHLIHYGSYETTFLKRMCERHGRPPADSQGATAVTHATNLLSFIYAQIYFPTYSNGLKEVAGYLGFRWSGSLTSGLETIVCRHRWEASRDPTLKQTLLDYNRQDCEALEVVANGLVDLNRAAPADSMSSEREVVLTSNIKRESPYSFKRIAFAIPEMEVINKAAYWDYQRDRVYVKSQQKSKRSFLRKPRSRSAATPNATIEYARPKSCPHCRSKVIHRHGRTSRTIIDLRFMRHGIKRWITRHILLRYRCKLCKKTFFDRIITRTACKYGHNLLSYTMYLNIELRLPQGHVDASVGKLFGLHIPSGTTSQFKFAAANIYPGVYDDLLKKLCTGSLLHVDETSVSVKGKNGYVWVLASMELVAYFFTPTREGGTIQAMLKEFSGVLVSDFYAAYDAIECPSRNA